jgi:CDP-4-dehydro-6-deoxyglucose reductase/ferredoxin-NAD(P)+ reductase (naphthalene dioxygenase ferredoxin-specific)
MSYRVNIPQFMTSIQVEPGQTILDAALKAGLDYPYACRQGNCSSCKTKVLNGEAEHIKPYDSFALSEEEKANGLILACRAAPRGPCEVEYLEDDDLLFSPRDIECVIRKAERVAHDVVVITARPLSGQPVSFSAGQFGNLTLPGMPPRDYSFANRPGAPDLEFHVRALQGGNVSRHLFDSAQQGDRFMLHGPLGTAYLRKDHPGPITIVVGGTGLAPAKSILLDALSELPGRAISLYFCARREADLYMVDAMRALAEKHANFVFFPIVTRTAENPERRTNDVFRMLAERFPTLAGHKIYTCGSPGLVSACQKFARESGLAPSDCHADPFVVAEGHLRLPDRPEQLEL